MINNIDCVDISNNKLDSNPKKLAISVKEFQELIGLSYQRTMDLIHRDDFPKLKVGRRILIISSKLDEWLESNIGLTL